MDDTDSDVLSEQSEIIFFLLSIQYEKDIYCFAASMAFLGGATVLGALKSCTCTKLSA
jgi:hypothetical protein